MKLQTNNNRDNLSNDNINRIKEENNIEIENIDNQEKEKEKVNEIQNLESSNKILTFIKTKPLLFSVIVIGICAIIILAITLPLVLINKTDEKSSNNNKNEGQSLIIIDTTKQFDFSNLNFDDIYTNIDDKRNDQDECCNYLSSISSELDDKEKVYLIYNWVAKNIEYYSTNYLNSQTVLTNKKGGYSDYAKLFTQLLTCLNFPAENIKNIIGHSKGIGFNYENPITDDNPNHEWNAVKIDNKWCLIDTTWGANTIIDEVYVRSYDEYYLCTPPAQFVRSHLPKKIEENLQFLDNPIDINTFQNMAFTTKYFFEYGFNGLSIDKMVLNICGEGKITLKYNIANRPILSVIVKKDGDEINNWFLEKKITNGYDIIFYINEAGNYDADFSAKKDINDDYKSIMNCKIKCDSTPNIQKFLPQFKDDYKNDVDIELISPIENQLIQGQKYTFEIISNKYDKLYLILESLLEYSSEIIEMDKEGTTFKAENVFIHGDSVIIAYKVSSLMNHLVVYITQGDLINFPQTSLTPFRKELISPLEINLIKGRTYFFKIISDTDYSFAIYYNGQYYNLEKNGKIYTITFQINLDSETELSIDYGYNDDHSDFLEMYLYNLVSE